MGCCGSMLVAVWVSGFVGSRFRDPFWGLQVVGCRWVMRCWFGCGWCSVDVGGSVLDFNFWVCVLRFGCVLVQDTLKSKFM